MSTIINASTSSGLVQTADNSGTLVLQSNGTSAAGVSGSNFQCDSGYGSVATAYGCRAWALFDGTRNVTNTGASTNGQPVYLKASGNVTSVTKSATGVYIVNFTNALPDANYAVIPGCGPATSRNVIMTSDSSGTSSVTLTAYSQTAAANTDQTGIHIAIFR